MEPEVRSEVIHKRAKQIAEEPQEPKNKGTWLDTVSMPFELLTRMGLAFMGPKKKKDWEEEEHEETRPRRRAA